MLSKAALHPCIDDSGDAECADHHTCVASFGHSCAVTAMSKVSHTSLLSSLGPMDHGRIASMLWAAYVPSSSVVQDWTGADAHSGGQQPGSI